MSRDFRKEVEYIPITAIVLAISEKAVKIRNSASEDFWVPKSCIAQHTLDTLENGERQEVYVAGWFAEKEGII